MIRPPVIPSPADEALPPWMETALPVPSPAPRRCIAPPAADDTEALVRIDLAAHARIVDARCLSLAAGAASGAADWGAVADEFRALQPAFVAKGFPGLSEACAAAARCMGYGHPTGPAGAAGALAGQLGLSVDEWADMIRRDERATKGGAP